MLDVACGSGTAALVAARRYCEVTGIDYVPALTDRAQRRAQAEGFDVDLRVADAQALPFDDASFDVVLSVYGVQQDPVRGQVRVGEDRCGAARSARLARWHQFDSIGWAGWPLARGGT